MSSSPLPSYAVSRDVAEAALCLMAMSRSGDVVDGQAVPRVPRSSVPPALRDVLHWDGDYVSTSVPEKTERRNTRWQHDADFFATVLSTDSLLPPSPPPAPAPPASPASSPRAAPSSSSSSSSPEILENGTDEVMPDAPQPPPARRTQDSQARRSSRSSNSSSSRRHGNRTAPCPHCGELRSTVNMRRHAQFHCPMGPRAKTACEACGEVMTGPSLERHRLWSCDARRPSMDATAYTCDCGMRIQRQSKYNHRTFACAKWSSLGRREERRARLAANRRRAQEGGF